MAILAAALAAAAGGAQAALNVLLFGAVFRKNVARAVAAAAGKLAVYAGFLLVLFLFFRDHALYAAIGFAAGFFPPLLIYGLGRLKKEP